MEDKDWTITAVSPQPAREWNNPNGGVVYYRSVKLDGWEKPVNLGKKDPDFFQVGASVYGHIIVQHSDKEDKFKAGNKQQGFGGGFSKPSSGFQKREYHDNSDGQRQGMCFNNAANYINHIQQKGVTMLPSTKWAEQVWEYANALYKLGDLGQDSPKAPAPNQAGQIGQSKPWKLQPGQDPWPTGKDDDAEFASLLESGLNADGISIEDIPF